MAVTATLQSDCCCATTAGGGCCFFSRILSVAPIAVREFLNKKHLMHTQSQVKMVVQILN
jgi:hypothetical protein